MTDISSAFFPFDFTVSKNTVSLYGLLTSFRVTVYLYLL